MNDTPVTLASFPEIVARLEQPTLTALKASLANDADVVASPSVFAAVEIEEFREELLARFAALEDVAAADVLGAAATLSLWPGGFARYAGSLSFRGAEGNFDQFILPFQPVLQEPQLTELFGAIENNGQIWDAARTPGQIANLLRSVDPHRPTIEAIDALYQNLPARLRQNFEATWNILEERGWRRPAFEQPDGE